MLLYIYYYYYLLLSLSINLNIKIKFKKTMIESINFIIIIGVCKTKLLIINILVIECGVWCVVSLKEGVKF